MSRLPVRTKPQRKKHCYVGPPAIFRLEMAVRQINEAWPHLDSFGCYLVGSSLDGPDFRDVDVRMIMRDDAFRAEFPSVENIDHASWEHDPKWLLLTVAVGEWLAAQTGLPIDFQFNPQTWANNHHAGARQALGLHYAPRRRGASE